jgi:hypothetical protein
MPAAVRLERDEAGLAVATFDSPPLNLFDHRMLEDLRRRSRRSRPTLRGRCSSAPRGGRSPAASTCTSSTGGVAAADDAVRADAGKLFATEDLQRAVKTFLAKGPGHAEFEGR